MAFLYTIQSSLRQPLRALTLNNSHTPFSSAVIKMSSNLKTILEKVIEEDYKRKEIEIEKRVKNFKTLLYEIAEAKRWDLAIWVEGSKVENVEKYEKELNLLERGNLIKGKMKFTERNAYREYQMTRKGSELVEKLQKETTL
jgi:hypothetical protein